MSLAQSTSFELVSREGFEGVRRRFLDRVQDSGEAELWQRLLALQADEAPIGALGCLGRTAFFEGDEVLRIVRESAGVLPPGVLAAGRRIDAALATAADGFASELEGPDRAAFAALFERVFRPLESLATVPLGELFAPEEVAAIGEDHPVGVPLETDGFRFDGSTGYAGYVCAIVKFTRHCNLRCTYCHDWDADPAQRISLEDQVTLFRNLLGSSRHRIVDVVWHGGEPTLLGRRGFQRILAVQQHFRRPGQVVRNMIQTNATALDDAWARLLRRYRIKVGVSIDGPRDLHDRRRRDAQGHATFDRVRRGIRLLEEQEILGGVIVVVGPETVELGGEAILRFLRDEGLTNACMLPVRPGAGDERPLENYLGPASFARFLLEIEDARTRVPGPFVRIRELDAAINALRRGAIGFCELQGNCHGAFYAVDRDGSVMHCDKFLGDSRHVIGNIRRDDFDAIRGSSALAELAAEDASALERYRGCPYFTYCRGWCPHERHVLRNVLRREAGDCCGLSPLFAGLIERGLGRRDGLPT